MHLGQPETRDAYAALLSRADVAVSTATNEFFGIAMVEASYAGCWPLVPDRLAYQELYPERFRYTDVDELTSMLRECVLRRPAPLQAKALADGFTFEALNAALRTSLCRGGLGRSPVSGVEPLGPLHSQCRGDRFAELLGRFGSVPGHNQSVGCDRRARPERSVLA